MSKNGKAVVAPIEVPDPKLDAPTDFALSLDEFCARLSARDRRVELIAAFHHVEKAAGRVHARESEFVARFDRLAHQPV